MNKFSLHPLDGAVCRFPNLKYNVIDKALYNSEYLDSIFTSDSFKEAVFYASPDLYDELDKYLSHRVTYTESLKIRNSLIKYLSRMSTRCTPFGAFASCTVAHIGDKTNLCTEVSPRYHFQYDMQFLCILVQKLIGNDINIYPHLSYVRNQTIYKVDNCYRYYVHNDNVDASLTEIRRNFLLDSIIQKISIPTSYNDLMNFVKSKFEIETSDFNEYIRSLCNKQIILCELHPNSVGNSYFQTICDISKYLSDSKTKEFIEQLYVSINTLNEFDNFKKRKEIIDSIYRSIQDFGIKIERKYVFHIDSYIYDNAISISKNDVSLLESAFNILRSINPVAYRDSKLQDFANRYEARYEQKTIPLLEALDPEIGIGFDKPDNVSSILAKATAHETKKSVARNINVVLNPFQQYLLQRIIDSDSHCEEIEITNEVLSKFHQQSTTSMPYTFAASFNIIGENQYGDILEDIKFLGRSSANLLARFAIGNPEIHSMVNRIAEFEQSKASSRGIAEISHISHNRTGNILQRPQFRKYTIDYIVPPHSQGISIPISDIMVSVRYGKITLTSKSLGIVIEPRMTTAHNFENRTSAVYRFLCHLQTADMLPSISFSWGGLEQILSHFPRIRYKNLIFARQHWKLNLSDIKHKNSLSIDKFKEYCNCNKISQKILYVDGDNTLYIDCNNDISIEAFFSAVKHRDSITVEEFLPADNETLQNNNFKKLNEILIPMYESKR